MKKISAILIGFGKMGFGLGHNDKLSHYGALKFLNNKFCLKSVIDKKFSKNQGFYSSDLNRSLKNHNPELAIISVSSKSHFNIVEKLLKSKFCPKVLFLDKPSFQNLVEFKKIKKLIKNKKNTKIILNQTYRFDKNLEKLRNIFRLKKFGKLHKVSINYTNGLKNNANHLFDIFFYLFNGNFKFRPLWSFKNPVNFFKNKNTNYDFCLLEEKKKITINGQSFDNNFFEIFEVMFYFSKCRIIAADFFKEYYIEQIKYDRFQNKEINRKKKLFKTIKNSPLINAYNLIYSYFVSKKINKKFEIYDNEKTIKLIDTIEKYV